MQEENSAITRNFRERLKWLRQDRELSQEALGQRLQKSGATISDWERGKHEPTVTDLFRIADALEVPVEKLLTGVSAAYPVLSEPQLAVLETAPHDSGSVRQIRDQIYSDIARLMNAADTNLARLGWVATQVEVHLRAPGHWGADPEQGEAARQRAIRSERSHMKAKAKRAADHRATSA